MLRYETLVLSSTHITDDELSSIENYFDKVLSEVEGRVISFEKWGKYRLAYPVKKNDYGIYILIRYELPKEKAKDIFGEIDSFFRIKCHEIVFRFVNLRMDENASLEYRRPESVDSRSSNLDSFIKENKMESLLESSYPSDSSRKNKEDAEEVKEEPVVEEKPAEESNEEK